MEPLIFALIIMAVSAFFSNKKKNDENSSPSGSAGKDQRSSGRGTGGFKRMEDYAKEMYGEFQAQMNPEADKKEQVKEMAGEVVERHVNRRPDRKTASAVIEQTGGRLSTHQKSPRVTPVKAAEESKSLFPLSQDEAKKAIILAEVFMPPKSKRR